MFKNKPASPIFADAPARPKPRSPGVPSIISVDMVIEGNLHSSGDVQVEGEVIGNVTALKLVIADGGAVTGNITADDVRICGALTGAVRAALVTLTATARVLGDVHHELLTIETGGRLEGQSRRLVVEPAILPEPVALEAPAWVEQPNHDLQHEHQH